MEAKQINCCISGPSLAGQHNLGCLAFQGGGEGADFPVQPVRPELTSSMGCLSPLHLVLILCAAAKSSAVMKSKGPTDPQSEHRVRAGKAGEMVAPHQKNHTEAEGEGVGYDGWN